MCRLRSKDEAVQALRECHHAVENRCGFNSKLPLLVNSFLVCGELGLRTALTMLTFPYTSAHNGSAECLLVADKALISGWA
jgi:hypothetical protein